MTGCSFNFIQLSIYIEQMIVCNGQTIFKHLEIYQKKL